MRAPLEPLGPIFTAHLFPELEARLLDLLCSLTPHDWEQPTLAPQWCVKDVAAHLLDTQLRKLSFVRDRFVHTEPGRGAPDAPPLTTTAALAAHVNRLNAEGVALFRRLSPSVLIALMDLASRQSCQFHQSLDPFADALFPVTWAGEEKSPNWFDTAREFTERWHHQQQIRLAVERPGILARELYFPVLDTFLRALPFHYRSLPAPPGSLAQFNVTGDAGGSWFLFRHPGAWSLLRAPAGKKISETSIPQEIAWRIFTKGIEGAAARSQIQLDGDAEVGLHILSMLSIVA